MKGWELEIKFVYLGIEKKQIKVMKVVKEIIEKLNEINALLEERLDASNMDVEFMMQRVEDMIDEFEEIEEFQFEEEEED
jgi:hypothetical protein